MSSRGGRSRGGRGGGRDFTDAPSSSGARNGGGHAESSRGRGTPDRELSDRASGRSRGPSHGPSRGLSRNPGGRNAGEKSRERLGDDEYASGNAALSQNGGTTVPDPKIIKKEDENLRRTKEVRTKDLVKSPDLPLRPGHGGKPPFVLQTNYFNVKLDENLELFKYNVSIEPIAESGRALHNRGRRRQFFNILFEEIPDFQLRRAGIVTDYANNLITREQLFDQKLPEKKYRQVYHGEYEQARGKNDPPRPKEQEYTVTVKSQGRVSTLEIATYIKCQPTDANDFASRQNAIQALNIIMAGSPNKDTAVFLSGQNKFYQYPRNVTNQKYVDAYRSCDLSGCLIAVRGYYSSIRTSTSKILLNLNAQCSPFYPEMNLLQMMKQYLAGSTSETSLQDLENFISKLRVRTEYTMDGKNRITRVMTISGFSHPWVPDLDNKGREQSNNDGTVKMKGTKGVNDDWGTADSVRINTVDPIKSLSVTQYFKEIHNIQLEGHEYGVLNCGSNDSPVWIPPELCTIMPGQTYRGTLNDKQTTKMLTIAARPPAENARRIASMGLEVMGVKPRSQNLNAFGISIDPNMLMVEARSLSPPQIVYSQQSSVIPLLAEWNMIRKNFYERGQITTWSYLNLSDEHLAEKTLRSFQDILKACGMGNMMPKPSGGFKAPLKGSSDDDQNDKSIRDAMAAISNQKVGIVLVILPVKSVPIYARVKFWADIRFGIHTVCVVGTKFQKASSTYWVNIAHKFNLKLGGINHTLSSDALGILNDGDTMVVGIGVAHPTPKSMENSPSIVGMVASIDKTFARWPGNFRIQDSRQEILKRRQEGNIATREDSIPKNTEDMVENFQILLRERLSYFYGRNRKYPKNILVYRDGVSESQHQAVFDLELKPMKEMCAKVYREKNVEPPKFTIVIVGKHHHTRFYPKDTNHADGKHNLNPLPGTVVDRGITMQKGWDFYLQAHTTLKGTAKPAHYVVLHDDTRLKADELEKITHSLSYLYERATTAISYCPPAYYAKRLCERGRCYLMKYLNMRGRPLGTKFDRNAKDVPWTKDVNEKLENSMFYI